MTTTSRSMDQALTVAREYARTHTADSGRLGQLRRTLDDLVGYRTPAGRWTLPPVVRRTMRGEG